MLRFPCLVLDHDDTVVQTERTVGYPYFRQYIEKVRPGQTLSFARYVHDCNNMIFSEMCRRIWNFTEEELRAEHHGWKEYLRTHVPAPFPGIGDVIRRQKEEGGLVCVVSLSGYESISRDYRELFGVQPDAIFGWDLPEHQRKPSPYPLEQIMARFGLAPEDMLVVDDMKLAWMMAHPLGVKVAHAGWSKPDFPKLNREMKALCDHSFDSTKELEKFLFD